MWRYFPQIWTVEARVVDICANMPPLGGRFRRLWQPLNWFDLNFWVQQKQMSTQQNSKNIPNMTQQSKYSGGGLNSRIASGGILYSEVNMVCGVRYVFIGCYKNNCLHNNTQRISPKWHNNQNVWEDSDFYGGWGVYFIQRSIWCGGYISIHLPILAACLNMTYDMLQSTKEFSPMREGAL